MKNFVIFVTGAVLGAVSAWQYAKKKFQQMADEEIEQVREYYRSKTEEQKQESVTQNEVENAVVGATEEYEKMAESYSKSETPNGKPEVIDPADFGLSTLCVTYTCYKDGVVTDERDDIVDDVEDVLGNEWRSVLENEDVVYIRNGARYCDYEIIADRETYAESHPTEDE